MYKTTDLAQEYKKKLITADAAADKVKKGDRVHFGTGCGTVVDIDKALAKRGDELSDVTVLSTVSIRRTPFETFTATESNEQVMFTSAHFSSHDRKMNKEGRCWYMPMMFNELPHLWTGNDNGLDIACFQVGPMDKFGNFNIGPQVADMWGVIKAAKIKIVEVNENMPKALGRQNEINLYDVDFVVEGSNTPLPDLNVKGASEIDQQIADHVVKHIKSGSTLQLGIGALPLSIGQKIARSDIKNVEAHTEMFTDAYVDLFEAGKLWGNKEKDKGKAVYTFAGGTKRLYDFIDDNPMCFVAPVDYVNNIATIAQIPNFVSVNSCIAVDLYGQVCSESAGYRQISGTGGQLDFVMGSFQSQNGHSFLCTPSVREKSDGSLESLIMPGLAPGSIITTPRMAVDYIVTEYGAVSLKGKSTWQRAELLISIAHPQFRDQLIKDAERMGIWTKSSKLL